MVGHHCPIMLLNRHAYSESPVGFRSFEGSDTGVALERDMRRRGWRAESFENFNEEEPTDASHRWFHHIGGGGSHYEKKEVEEKRKLCAYLAQKMGYNQ